MPQEVKSYVDLFGAKVKLFIESNGVMQPFTAIAGNAANYIESISVRIGLLETFRLEIKLCPPLQDAVTLINKGIIGFGFTLPKTDSNTKTTSVGDGVKGSGSKFSLNKIALQISYGGLNSPTFKAYLLQPDVEVGEDGIDITLHGMGMLFEATKVPGQIIGSMTPYDAVRKWFGDGVNTDVVFDSEATSALKEGGVKPFVETTTGFESAVKVLKNHNCHMYQAGADGPNGRQKIHVVHDKDRRKTTANGKPILAATFVAFKQIDPNKRIYPILNLSTTINNLLLTAAMHGTISSVTKKSDKSVSQQNAGASSYQKNNTSNIPTQDSTVGGGATSGDKNDRGEPSGVSDGESVGSVMGAIEREYSSGIEAVEGLVHSWMNQPINYSISTIMIPNLLPGRMVGVQVSDIKALTGNYDLKSVEHTIGGNGADTKLELTTMGGLLSSASQKINKLASGIREKVLNSSKTDSTKGVNK